jgi:hypothetical protein
MANLRVDKITRTETFETTGSVQFDGTGDYLSLTNIADFRMGSEDFTVECWVYPVSSGANEGIVGIWEASSGRTWLIYINSTIKPVFIIDGDGSGGGEASASGPDALPLNTWTHLAGVRYGNYITLYVNGASVAKVPALTVFNNTSDPLEIGRFNSANEFEGHISNVRVVKGKALYTENFTPPTRELTVTPETVLLACQHKTDASHEKTGKTITVNGNAVANELTPGLLTDVVKSGGSSAITGSVEFDGTGDYLSVTPTDDFELGSDDFTIEAWVYSANWKASLANAIFSKGNSSSVSTEFYSLQATQTDGRVQFFWRSGSALLDGSNTRNLSTDSWNHIAVTRSGDTFNLYINGILDDTTTSSTTLDTGVTGGVFVGAQSYDPTNNNRILTGNISNLRIVKGTALYTDNFIPPTRELKKVSGTVLLCCQDSNDPTTEATGKTITGYGDLQKADGVELISNGTFNTDVSGWTTDTSTITFNSGAADIDRNSASPAANQIYQEISGLTVGQIYLISIRILALTNTVSVYFDPDGAEGTVEPITASTIGTHTGFYTATQTSGKFSINATTSTTATATVDDISMTLYDSPNRASNFTPQVGNDGSVEFVGPTKINTENYFYLPTGNTESRGGNRGVWAGGYKVPNAAEDNLNTIEYITISSMGNSIDFGDRINPGHGLASFSSSTRGIFLGGRAYNYPASPTHTSFNTIDYIEFSSTSNALDFGDLTSGAAYIISGASDSTRGIVNIGSNREYITIASKGNTQTFGTSPTSANTSTGFASPTRGFCAGGAAPGAINTIDYVTIQSTGNTLDFGDLIFTGHCMGTSNTTRAVVFTGGYPSAPSTDICYITMASTGNAQDFGDTTQTMQSHSAGSGCASATRAVRAGGYVSPGAETNAIEYVTIASTGNAQDFGDLLIARHSISGCSNGHGGLG